MARKPSSLAAAYKASGKDRAQDIEEDEVDAFHSQREKIAFNEDEDDDDMVEYSDEEVMSVGSTSSEEEEEEQEQEQETGGGWGSNKSTYYDADSLDESDDAQEQQDMAVKHQRKHLEDMAEEDFLDVDDIETWSKSKPATTTTSTTTATTKSNIKKLTPAQRIQFLESQYPELYPLSCEYTRLSQLKDCSDVENTTREMYLAALSCYFMLLTDKSTPTTLTDLKDHGIMETLIKAREAWRVAQNIKDKSDIVSNQQEEEEEEDYESCTPNDQETDTTQEEIQEVVNQDKLLDLPSSLGRKGKRKLQQQQQQDDDFADTTMLTPEEMLVKQKKKQSLRFYTSKIDQKLKNRQSLLTGDEDLPYKERAKERSIRLNEEARLRGLEEQDKLGQVDGEQGNNNNSSSDDDGYYDMVKEQKALSKLSKQKAHKEAIAAGATTTFEPQSNGKRAINYQIEKNKGLSSKKKSIKNPRVKKRNKYQVANKKLKSMKPVFKQPLTSYQGELTGIKKNLKRSINLSH